MEDEEREAYLYGGLNAHEYATSIGKSDLADLTSDQWITFCECMCKNYHSKYNELQNKLFFCE